MIMTAFDINVYGYLWHEGYTYLQLKGLQPVTQTGDQYYYVVPLKKDDPRIADLESDGALEDEETWQLLERMTYATVMVKWTIPKAP